MRFGQFNSSEPSPQSFSERQNQCKIAEWANGTTRNNKTNNTEQQKTGETINVKTSKRRQTFANFTVVEKHAQQTRDEGKRGVATVNVHMEGEEERKKN